MKKNETEVKIKIKAEVEKISNRKSKNPNSKMFGVTILGNNSAVPAFDRHPTSQVVSTSQRNFLVDCGEGTQIQLAKYKVRKSKISHIFISHLHGDHYFGLIGLINSFALQGRQQDLHIAAPPQLEAIINIQLNAANTRLPYNLCFHPITNSGKLMMVDDIEISCFKTDHLIDCYGFKFSEIKNPRSICIEKVQQFQVPISYYAQLQNGKDYVDENNNVVKNEILTTEAPKGKTYCFCADTKYNENLLDHISGADMIYYETTYLDNFAHKAAQRYHSTTKQAGELCKKAKVKKLLIGHFSSKYEVLDDFLNETREVFPHTELAMEGLCFPV
jgi:ribonuclease Z